MLLMKQNTTAKRMNARKKEDSLNRMILLCTALVQTNY